MSDALITGGQLGRTYSPCMGGWCRIRQSCPHYTHADEREPDERICEPGKDGEAVQVRRHRPIGSWEGQPIKPASFFPEVA
jgi:hypothetical protein